MQSSRQSETSERQGLQTTPVLEENEGGSLRTSTAAILSTLQPPPPDNNLLYQSFYIIDPTPTETWPAATIVESHLIQSKKDSDSMKAVMGVKSSSHSVEIVGFNEDGCDVVISPPCPQRLDLNKLPGKSSACYIFTTDKKVYYADKKLKLCNQIDVSQLQFETLCELLQVNVTKHAEEGYAIHIEELNTRQLIGITANTGHIHGMGFYKLNEPGSVMSSIESANSIAYQLLGPRYFPTCYTVRDDMSRLIGVYSRLLPGFTPNRDKPLQQTDLEVSSLRNMIKKRDEQEISCLQDVFKVIGELLPLMKREVNKSNSYFYQAWEYARNTSVYYLGDENSAVHIRPKLEKMIKQNIHTITFGQLETLRQWLIRRRITILQTQASYVSSQHRHNEELVLIDKAIEKLNHVLLNETTLYFEHLYQLSCRLQDNWVDIEKEMLNPESPYGALYVEEGMVARLHIPLVDILHFRIQCGLAIGLSSRYFMLDPDGHSKNICRDGRNVDGDLALFPLTYRFKLPGKKPSRADFALYVEDFLEFPNLKKANFRYWPTCVAILDTSADTALSPVSDMTKNYFTTEDNLNFQSLCEFPIFNLQKYIQLIIMALTDRTMFTCCAILHMPDDLHMLNDDGNASVPLPLIGSKGERQDVRQKWIDLLTARSQEARELALKLAPLRKIMEHHSDLILKLVIDHFRLFMNDRSHELNTRAMTLLEEGVKLSAVKSAFEQLKQEIMSSTANLDMSGVSLAMRHTH